MKDFEIKVVFANEDLSKKYQCPIALFLNDLLKREKSSSIRFEIEERKVVEDKNVFFIETTESLGNGVQILPTYETTSLDEPLGLQKKEKPREESKSQGVTCFNCLGNHHLKECPEQHNGNRIASNKKELMEAPTVRYHSDDVLSFDVSSKRPGFISNELRGALNLRPNQLPFYIYNMRILGYPPGWMKEAEIETSGLNVYKSHEKSKDDRAGSLQEGMERYDGNKFVSFPGFNTAVPRGMIDEWKVLKMPPMQEHQQLTEALRHKLVTVDPDLIRKRSLHDALRGKDSLNCDKKSPNRPTGNGSSSREPNASAKSLLGKRPKSVTIGSLLINTENPYKRLPHPDKFSVGVSEYLPYENLPDAVGVYDQKLRGVLTDVRHKMSRQNSF